MTGSRPARVVRAIIGHRLELGLLAVGGAAVLAAVLLTVRATPAPLATGASRSWVVDRISVARWGVDQLRIRRTAQGHLLDLRYHVVDPRRAGSLLAEDGPVYVVHERSGMKLPVPRTPKAGALRTTGTPRAGRSYFALFTNPGGMVRRGDQVSVVLGELTARLTVE